MGCAFKLHGASWATLFVLGVASQAYGVSASIPSQIIEGPVIRHTAPDFLPNTRYPLIEFAISPGSRIATAKLYFRSAQYPHFYYVEMRRQTDGDRFQGVIPIPDAETTSVVYFVDALDRSFSSLRSPFYTVEVTGNPASASFTGGDPGIVVGQTVSSAPLTPPGFRVDGVIAYLDIAGQRRDSRQPEPPPPQPQSPVTPPATRETKPDDGGGHTGLVIGLVAAGVGGYFAYQYILKDLITENAATTITTASIPGPAANQTTVTSFLAVPPGDGSVSGSIVLNGARTLSVDNRSPANLTLTGMPGANLLEAFVVTAGGEGAWRFDFSRATGFIPGSIEVRQGQVLSTDGYTVVFRLSGTSGEQVQFKYGLR